jgi:periplasmic protein CpxP/Spy
MQQDTNERSFTMRRYLGVFMVFALALTVAAGAALARGFGHMGGGPGGGPGHMGFGFGPRAAEALGLSADQQKQLADLRTKVDDELAPVRAQLEAKHKELWDLWTAPNPDRNAILAKQAEIEPLRQRVQAAMVDFRLAALKVLTPEQRTKAQSLVAQHGGGFGPGAGPGPGGCPCGAGAGADGGGPGAWGMGPQE